MDTKFRLVCSLLFVRLRLSQTESGLVGNTSGYKVQTGMFSTVR